jgi:hypothetical protein
VVDVSYPAGTATIGDVDLQIEGEHALVLGPALAERRLVIIEVGVDDPPAAALRLGLAVLLRRSVPGDRQSSSFLSSNLEMRRYMAARRVFLEAVWERRTNESRRAPLLHLRDIGPTSPDRASYGLGEGEEQA